jgi:predicted CXXCH cytochrome family protein
MRARVPSILAVLFALATPLSAQGLAGSDHDFTSEAWNVTGEMCRVCHTPHDADRTVPNAPLWNHSVPDGAAFTPYSSTTLDALVAGPDGTSKLCLGCHDGMTALDSYGGMIGSTVMTGKEVIGTNLADDHPISFVYDLALATADGELADPTSSPSGLGGTIAVDLLIGGRLECSSCHDAHNSSGAPDMLQVWNNESLLCRTCHIK